MFKFTYYVIYKLYSDSNLFLVFFMKHTPFKFRVEETIINKRKFISCEIFENINQKYYYVNTVLFPNKKTLKWYIIELLTQKHLQSEQRAC